MQVTSRVNTDGLITLELAPEVSDVAPPAAYTATGSPTLTIGSCAPASRSETTDNRRRRSDQGYCFRNRRAAFRTSRLSVPRHPRNALRARTEFLVMITPHVVNDQRSARALTGDMRNQ